jgi:transposase
MENVTVLGIDLAKEVFQLHGADQKGRKVFNKQVSRKKLIEFMTKLPPCLVGMEACATAHYWARKFTAMGHTVKLMAPQFVKPYVKSNKNDYNDAEAIAEAVTRPTMRFVPQKNVEQQSIQAVHRARELWVGQRTALCNHIRGVLMEFGIAISQGVAKLAKELPSILEDAENELTPLMRECVRNYITQLENINIAIKEINNKIQEIAQENEKCQRIMKIEGVGVLTATAIVAAVGNAKEFKNGREMAAWIGLVPKQRSSGNKTVLLGISKRGDRYLRRLLIQGGHSVVRVCTKKEDKRNLWVKDKKQTIGTNKTAVAVANKNARIIWALLANNDEYKVAV